MSRKPTSHEATLAAGQMLGRYELLLPIASGGMGNVWAARLNGTRGFHKLVAIKTILSAVDHPALEEMLFQEATLASQIHHPNVVETLELGEHDGSMYLVMELVLGESLSFIMRAALAEGGLPFQVCVNLIGQVCRGLHAAHELCDASGNRIGLVHRDISPANVLVTYSGIVKIVDFGVATTSSSATHGSGEIKGKISYLAPEQLQGIPLDARVDVFTTGLLLYLMTVGRHPFRSPADSDTLGRILSDVPVTPPSAHIEDYPEALEAVVLRALEKRRERRFPSAMALADALEAAFPTAFGPQGDRATRDYIQELLKSRMVERRATLRLAEELAEHSPTRDSVLSVPAMVAARAPSRPFSRGASLAVGATLLALGAFATASRSYMQAPKAVAVQAATLVAPQAAAASPAGAAPRASAPAIAGTTRLEGASGTSASGASGALNLAAARAAFHPGAAHRRDSSPRAHGENRDSDDPSEATSALTGRVDSPAELANDAPGGAVQALASSESSPGAPPAPTANAALAPTSGLPSPLPEPAKPAPPTRPRLVPSKVGHANLAVNPRAEAYRPNLPSALERATPSFVATLAICVNATGGVSSVKVLASAGPTLDAILSRALSRWRYRPLLENGVAVPFCYPLKYEFAGR